MFETHVMNECTKAVRSMTGPQLVDRISPGNMALSEIPPAPLFKRGVGGDFRDGPATQRVTRFGWFSLKYPRVFFLGIWNISAIQDSFNCYLAYAPGFPPPLQPPKNTVFFRRKYTIPRIYFFTCLIQFNN
jgi:hypothetical protein